jgi:hypothetical protein
MYGVTKIAQNIRVDRSDYIERNEVAARLVRRALKIIIHIWDEERSLLRKQERLRAMLYQEQKGARTDWARLLYSYIVTVRML